MMPMQGEEYGREKDGTLSADYCGYCYKDGVFADESITMEQMVEFCIPFAIKAGEFQTAEEARADMLVSYKKMKRWA